MSPAANPSRSQLSVQIDADVHEAIKAAAYWGRRPKAAVVEDALRAYLDTLQPELTAPLPGEARLIFDDGSITLGAQVTYQVPANGEPFQVASSDPQGGEPSCDEAEQIRSEEH